MPARHWVFSAFLFCHLTTVTPAHAEPSTNHASEWSACHSRLAAHINIIATDAAIDCGFFNLAQSPERFEEIKSCAKAIVETGQPFKFGHADYGDDSLYCHVAIRDPSGRLWSYFYDSDISGGSGGPSSVDISKCQALTFQKGTIGKHSFFNLEGCEPDKELNAILRE